MNSEIQLADILTRAIERLLASRGAQGNWHDVRSTAMATWALSEVLTKRSASPSIRLPEIRSALKDAQPWLIGQSQLEEWGASWESEAWDTALAVIALSSINSVAQPSERDAFAQRIDQALAWLQRIRSPVTGAWYDEVWETTLCTVALLRGERLHKGPVDRSRWIEGVLDWLVKIPSKPSGEFVCPHYSGFLAWLLGEITESHHARTLRSTAVFADFVVKVDRAVEWLLANASCDPDRLWSHYTFANAYIGYGLSILSRKRQIDIGYASSLVDWLRECQGQHGGYEDTEDTALAVLSLASLLHHAPSETESLFTRLSRLSSRTGQPELQCFLGYSSASSQVASEIKSFLHSRLPISISFKDWKWDFRPGHILIHELREASRNCAAAIFLLTKDDTLVAAKGSQPAPRDNVVFEAGYFAGLRGIEKTILIVEEDTKVPTDLGGVLRIPLTDRANLEGVYLELEHTLRRMLAIE